MPVHVCSVAPTYYQTLAWEKYCLPEFQVCDPNPEDGLVKPCEETWNAILCPEDLCYSMPVLRGDLVHFQTRYRDNWNDEDLTDGIGTWIRVRLVSNGETVSDVESDFMSRYMVGREKRGDYQLYEVDTSLPLFDDLNCWHLEFTVYDQTESELAIVNTGCTEEFCFITDCDQYMTFEPLIQKYDGFGYYYGDPINWVGDNFNFNPVYRLRSAIHLKGIENQKVITGESVSLLNVREVYHVDILDWVAPYVLILLGKMLLAPKYTKIDGIKYETENQTITRRNKGNRNLSIIFNVYKNGETTSTDC